MNQSDKDYSDVDSLWVEDGVIRTSEGNAQEPFLALLHSKGEDLVQYLVFLWKRAPSNSVQQQ